MDEYFITKKAVEIILENINDHFVKCLVNLSINDRYTNDIKLILGIIELLKVYMTTRRNDILSSCIKYTNKSYYSQLTDSLFRIIQSYLVNAPNSRQHLFIYDLIYKYNNPVISNISKISRHFNDDTSRNRFNTYTDRDYGDYNEDGKGDGDGDGDGEGYIDAQDPSYAAGTGINNIPQIPKDAGTLFKEAYYKLKNSKNKDGNSSLREYELQKIEVKNSNNDLL
jgi:hypothetical protein